MTRNSHSLWLRAYDDGPRVISFSYLSEAHLRLRAVFAAILHLERYDALAEMTLKITQGHL